jgi:dihydrofolate synthase/folylpolyglutamate synthase
MTYRETIDYLFKALPMYQRVGEAAYKADLNTTLAIDAYFKHPHKNFITIHVAGTNGKGSVSHMLASVLQEAGYKTGLYTSPHLKDFRERIRVNGEVVAEEYVVRFMDRHRQIFEDHQASFFEMTVALAFKFFSDSQIDIAVVEVGMGGRLDSTNIITPVVSVITNIGFDHTRFLGNTLTQIASEKAGIIKNGVPVVIGEYQSETANVFKSFAENCSAPIVFADSKYIITKSELEDDNTYTVNHGDRMYKLDLQGYYQQKNLAAVLATVHELSFSGIYIQPNCLSNGLKNVIKNTGLKGRWQVLQASPFIVCDVGHNTEGVKELLKQINKQLYNRLYIVWGMVNDKDASKVLSLLPKNAYYFFTQANIPRAMSAEILLNEANKLGLQGELIYDVKEALNEAIRSSESNDFVFIGGSTFVVAELDL